MVVTGALPRVLGQCGTRRGGELRVCAQSPPACRRTSPAGSDTKCNLEPIHFISDGFETALGTSALQVFFSFPFARALHLFWHLQCKQLHLYHWRVKTRRLKPLLLACYAAYCENKKQRRAQREHLSHFERLLAEFRRYLVGRSVGTVIHTENQPFSRWLLGPRQTSATGSTSETHWGWGGRGPG